MKEDEMERIISKNLKKIMKEFKIKQYELAKIAGVSESAAGKWILGKSTPRMGAIQKMADHFGIPKSYILNESPANMIETTGKTVRIPILGKIACGDPIFAEENFEDYRVALEDGLPAGRLVYLQAKGDSMAPTIPDGAMVIIREQPDVENGEIAAVLVNGNEEATLKRVKKQDDHVVLLPDNSAHDPIFAGPDYPIKIIGKAMRFEQEL